LRSGNDVVYGTRYAGEALGITGRRSQVRGRGKRRKALWAFSALLAVMVVLAGAGCGGDDGGGGGESGDGVIRFTFAPDPVWRWLTDQGIREKMEQEAKIQILDSATWDEYGIYAGGNADIVSVGSFEVPDIVEKSGVDSVIIGKYNIARAVIGVPKDSPAQSLSDLKGKRLTTFTTVSDALLWGALAKKLEDFDLKSNGGDLEMVIADVQNMGPLAASGEADACICLPDFAIEQFRTGKLRMLYDGKSDAQMFQDEVLEGHDGPMINIFLVRKDFYDDHPREVKFFLKLWQRGLDEWKAHKDEIIEAYPQDFAAQNDQDLAWIKDWLNENDWFVDSVYLDQKWVDEEKKVFDLLRETGFMPEDAEDPEFAVMEPGS
jgi:ABC-type nitrate/sulfonate/bicarbonate transport system substrate-binding protein